MNPSEALWAFVTCWLLSLHDLAILCSCHTRVSYLSVQANIEQRSNPFSSCHLGLQNSVWYSNIHMVLMKKWCHYHAKLAVEIGSIIFYHFNQSNQRIGHVVYNIIHKHTHPVYKNGCAQFSKWALKLVQDKPSISKTRYCEQLQCIKRGQVLWGTPNRWKLPEDFIIKWYAYPSMISGQLLLPFLNYNTFM